MNSAVSTFFSDPVVLRGLLSAGVIIVTAMLVVLARRMTAMMTISEDKKARARHWIYLSGIIILGVSMARIWLYSYLSTLFSPDISENIIRSILLMVFLAVLGIVLGRLLIPQAADTEKRLQYRKLIHAFFFILFLLFLIQIWSDVQIFKNTIIRRIIYSLIAFAVIYLSLLFVHRFINSLKIDITRKHLYRKRSTYTVAFILIVSLIPIWAGSTKQWATVFSVVGAGIALAMRDVLLNIAGWFYIVIRRPFREGDRIEIDNIKGDVIDIQLFQSTLLEIGNWVKGDQSTGRMILLPNGKIFQSPLHNYTKGFEYIWDEVSICVTFDSNWKKAEEILLTVGDDMSKDIQNRVKGRIKKLESKYLIYYTTFTPIVYVSVEESGVQLTLRFLTETKRRRECENIIARSVMDEINRLPDVDLAYPTVRVHKQMPRPDIDPRGDQGV